MWRNLDHHLTPTCEHTGGDEPTAKPISSAMAAGCAKWRWIHELTRIMCR
jgi:hypothetical protein